MANVWPPLVTTLDLGTTSKVRLEDLRLRLGQLTALKYNWGPDHVVPIKIILKSILNLLGS